MRYSWTQRTNKRTATATLSRFLFISALLAVVGLALVAGVSSAVETRSVLDRTKADGATDRVRFPRGRPSAAQITPEVMALPVPLLATITVDRTDDNSSASACTAAANDCSLRGAISFANLFPGTTVSVPAGSYSLTIAGAGEGFSGNNSIGDLDITGNNTSIVGAGAAVTIIAQTTAGSRVIEINPFIVANLTASISGVTISGGTETTGVGGGGILSGALNNNLTISNSVISGNSATGVGTFGGGGICHTGGNLTITGSSISNNSTSASGGGVSYSAGDPAGSNGAIGTINVSGSTFSGNTANSVSSGGGALDLYDFNVSASVYNVSSSSFSNNSAPNRSGGAIIVKSGGPLIVTTSSFASNSAGNSGGAIFSNGTTASVTYSRLVGNTAPTGHQIFRSSGLFAANDDWWGSNTGPGAGAFTSPSGDILPLSYLQLRAIASPNTICAGGTSSIVADIKQRNVGGMPLTTELNGLPPFPATFNNTTPAVGSLSAVSANFVNGEATATFTGSTAGTADIDVVADNQTVTASIIVQGNTTTDPADQTVCEGGTATFTTNSSGPGPFTYVWKKGATVLNIGDLGGRVTITSGSNASTLSISSVQASDADTYTVEATGACSTVTQTATLTINPPTTTTDPADQTVCQGAMASFSTTAGGAGPFSYAWTVDGSPSGGNSPTLNVDTTGLSVGNHTVSVTTTGACGSASQSATLTVQATTTTTDPADQTVCQGAMASFSTTAGGTGPFSYAWTVDGSPSGGDSPSLNVDTTGLSAGNHTVSVTTTGACGSASQSATLTVQPTTTTTDPADATVCQGAMANFSTTAGGTGPFSYAWTVDGSPAGTNSPNLSVDTTGFSVGNHTVSVTTTGACGSATQNATLTVQAPTTTSDPPDQTVCKGATAMFSTTPGGTGPFSYAWTVDGVPFNGDSPSISVPTGSMSSGPHTVTVTTTGTCGSASQSAILTVGSPPVITLTTTNINVWPPNHAYQTFTAADFGATATGCGGDLTNSIVIASVSSDEPEDNPTGADGNTLNDILIAANCKSVQLRRERDGDLNGRVYTITFKVVDSAGNTTTATATVSVPLNQSNGAAVNGPGPGYTVISACP